MRARRAAVPIALLSSLTVLPLTMISATADSAGLAAERTAKARDYTVAVIGDLPYTSDQLTNFPARIREINADPQVRAVVHLGDIKSGSSVCSDEYFAQIRTDFDLFNDPLVYTPGDNEWTDCHRPDDGSYNPLERLDRVREVFFPTAGSTLGQRQIIVRSQAALGFPENVMWTRARVTFSAVHIVGSNNDLSPWTGNTSPTAEQNAEVIARVSADVQQIHDAFDHAKSVDSRAVALMTQADVFDPTNLSPTFADYYGFQAIVQAMAQEAADFDHPVYLFNGDSHVFRHDNPLAAGSAWLDLYDVAPVENLTRYTVEGSTADDEWLKVTVHRRGPQVLSTQRILFEH